MDFWYFCSYSQANKSYQFQFTWLDIHLHMLDKLTLLINRSIYVVNIHEYPGHNLSIS